MHNQMIIDTNVLKENLLKIVSKNNNYKYHMAVVKANCYNLSCNEKIIKTLLDNGINYLVVSNVKEALSIRHIFKDVPILCLEQIDTDDIITCKNNDIAITVATLDYLNSINVNLLNNLLVHIRISTGFIGISKKEEFVCMYNTLINNGSKIVGVYSHIYDEDNVENNNKQVNLFKELVSSIDYNNIPIFHIYNGMSLLNSVSKDDLINGFRVGSIIYGFNKNSINLELCLKYISKIIDVRFLNKGQSIGYSREYILDDDAVIGIIPIGYSNGFNKKNKGSYVYINDHKYEILCVCMCESFIKIDNSIKVNDEVVLLKDLNHLLEITNHLKTVPEEMILDIKNVDVKII